MNNIRFYEPSPIQYVFHTFDQFERDDDGTILLGIEKARVDVAYARLILHVATVSPIPLNPAELPSVCVKRILAKNRDLIVGPSNVQRVENGSAPAEDQFGVPYQLFGAGCELNPWLPWHLERGDSALVQLSTHIAGFGAEDAGPPNAYVTAALQIAASRDPRS